MSAGLTVLAPEALQRYLLLQADAVRAVTDRFSSVHGAAYAQYGPRAWDACREDLAFHLEFLRPALEFGLLQPMVDYLCWLDNVLTARDVPRQHLALSLQWLGEFFAERMNAADGAAVNAALLAARTAFVTAKLAPPEPPEPWPDVIPFEAALLAGHQGEARSVMNHCMDRGNSLVEIEMHVIQPALYRIGEKWQANDVTVAQEHLATAIVESVMTVGLLRALPPESNGKRALLACVDGNIHAIGLRMVADAFQLSGWDVQYLGASVPTTALIRQSAQWRPHLVGLSVAFAQQLRFVKQIVTQLDDQFGTARPAVIIGGLAINRFNRLADLLGADAFGADAAAAVTCANRIVSGVPANPNLGG